MYKVYYSQKNIPWINPSLSVYPTMDITDSFFNFIEISDGQAVYFDTFERARIVVNDKSVKYFKIEKIENNQIVEETYWYTDVVSKILSNGIEVEIKLDYFMTYILKILKQFKKDNLNVLMDRATINDTLLNNGKYRVDLLQGMSREDELLDVVEKKYNKGILLHNTKSMVTNEYKFGMYFSRDLVYQNNKWNEKENQKFNMDAIGFFEEEYLFRNTYYFVFRNKWGKYIIFPIIGIFLSSSTPSEGILQTLYNNQYSAIFDRLVNRTGKGITEVFESNSFLGVYPGPLFDLNQNNVGGGVFRLLDYDTSGVNPSYAGYFGYIFEPNYGLKATLYHNIELNQNLYDRYISYYESIFYAGEEIKPIDYFRIIESDKNPYLKFRILFNDGFKGVIHSDYYLNYATMDYGGNLPSADATYHEQTRQININRNTGLIAAAGNIAWGLGAKNFEGAAIKTFSNLFKLGIEIPQQRRMIKSGFLTSATNDMNSMNQFSTFIARFFENKTKTEISDFNKNKGLAPYLIKNTFTNNTRQQMKDILKRNGFSINSYLGFADFIDTVKNEEFQYFKVNEDWLTNNLDYIQKHDFIPPRVLETIIEMFNEGIRMKKWV